MNSNVKKKRRTASSATMTAMLVAIEEVVVTIEDLNPHQEVIEAVVVAENTDLDLLTTSIKGEMMIIALQEIDMAPHPAMGVEMREGDSDNKLVINTYIYLNTHNLVNE
jgi:hypothetical protein